MIIENNYSITQLFVNKEIKIIIDRKQAFSIKVPIIRDLYEDTK
jgi:hypothetical protein